MKYEHRFHAGNFADVHKHVALLSLLSALQRKDSGLLVLDTHAGAGAYALAGATQGEAALGIHALRAAGPVHAPALQAYLGAIDQYQRESGADGAALRTYPGSLLLAARALRAQDRAVGCELYPAACRALRRAVAGQAHVSTLCTDGFAQIRAQLPPHERRALVLIDPPYEQSEDWARSLEAISEAVRRLSNAVVLWWYPIKSGPPFTPWPAVQQLGLARNLAALELWLYPRDARAGLNGSGLLVVNPPFRWAEEARGWNTELHALLDSPRRGGARVLASEAGDTHGA